MFYYLSKIALAPVLLWQGKRVRKNVVRLPEPTGKRQGIEAVLQAKDNSKQIMNLLIIGDSSAAGVGVETQAQALAGQLIEKLATKLSHSGSVSHVIWQLIAQTGDTSTDVVTKLNQWEQQQIKHCPQNNPIDFAIVVMGVNDVTTATSITTWQNNISKIIARLIQHQVKHIIFCALPPMHQFVALPQPLRWWLGLRATQLNKVLKKHIKDQPNCVVFTSSIPFEVKYLAIDGFHPSALTYEQWAEQLAELMVNCKPKKAV